MHHWILMVGCSWADSWLSQRPFRQRRLYREGFVRWAQHASDFIGFGGRGYSWCAAFVWTWAKLNIVAGDDVVVR